MLVIGLTVVVGSSKAREAQSEYFSLRAILFAATRSVLDFQGSRSFIEILSRLVVHPWTVYTLIDIGGGKYYPVTDGLIQAMVRLCPRRRQTMLLSATITEQVDELIKLLLDKPVRLTADPTTNSPSTLTE
ncbi:DNA/RNA helicase, DEAD/DEAH box type, N-terminal [Artemisia annua]|uniref:DNA/RNA helicase, DEAD/DEAH box type, N-terminal n=1 Tax=Artemisia annua TaxID=35608 RepID=A0A2U1PX56_ARTAN|nr:DNA/RNA helicase, DEAD/DEAH box type, N-terminal [Artemisia annua]